MTGSDDSAIFLTLDAESIIVHMSLQSNRGPKVQARVVVRREGTFETTRGLGPGPFSLLRTIIPGR